MELSSLSIVAPVFTIFGAVFGAIVASRASKYGADVARENAALQIALQKKIKIAEFRQAWANDLRKAMSEFQSFGVTPNLEHNGERQFYAHGTHIELLMNPDDPDYAVLRECLYDFLQAETTPEKYAANPKFIDVCQRILKREWDITKAELLAS